MFKTEIQSFIYFHKVELLYRICTGVVEAPWSVCAVHVTEGSFPLPNWGRDQPLTKVR